MVGYSFAAEERPEFVKQIGGCSFEPRVGAPICAAPVHDIMSFLVESDHFCYFLLIILQIGIDTYIGIGLGGEQPCQDRSLVPEITGKIDTSEKSGLMCQVFDDRPCFILAAIVYKADVAIRWISPDSINLLIRAPRVSAVSGKTFSSK